MGTRGLVCASQVKADDDTARRELVRAGVGVAVLEREEAVQLEREGAASLWEPKPPLVCPLRFVHSRRRRGDPLIRALVECVRDVWCERPASTGALPRPPRSLVP